MIVTTSIHTLFLFLPSHFLFSSQLSNFHHFYSRFCSRNVPSDSYIFPYSSNSHFSAFPVFSLISLIFSPLTLYYTALYRKRYTCQSILTLTLVIFTRLQLYVFTCFTSTIAAIFSQCYRLPIFTLSD